MAKRTDTHRPTALVPSEYEYVAVEYLKIEHLGDVQYMVQQRAILAAHMERTGATWSRHVHGGNCMVCGNANAVYTVAFYHAKTNSYVRMGQNCAAEVDGLTWNSRDMDCMRRAVADARERKAGMAKAQALLADAGLPQVWDMVQQPYTATEPRPLGTMRDIVGKLVKYGSASDAQVRFLHTLAAQLGNWAAVQAQRDAERAAAQPAPTGRVTVDVEVVKVEVQENDYGVRTVMTVKAADGWLAWGTVPAQLPSECRGMRVRLTATFTPSDRDPKFAFFKRPLAVVLADAPEVAA
jgi:hypothetical protein